MSKKGGGGSKGGGKAPITAREIKALQRSGRISPKAAAEMLKIKGYTSRINKNMENASKQKQRGIRGGSDARYFDNDHPWWDQ